MGAGEHNVLGKVGHQLCLFCLFLDLIFFFPIMLVDNHVIETSSSGTRLKAAVKRYRPKNRGVDNEAGYILVFAHGTGFRMYT